MKSKALVIIAASVFAAVLAFASASRPGPQGSIYGFDVRVAPDRELTDFVQCGMTVFKLDTEELVAELPALVIDAGGSNSMVYTGVDDVEVVFDCSVNDEMTEASYEIAGRRGDQLVMNHLATVRLQ